MKRRAWSPLRKERLEPGSFFTHWPEGAAIATCRPMVSDAEEPAR